MTVKPTPPPAASPACLVLNVDPATKSISTVRSDAAMARLTTWTWTRIVRYASLYYLVNVIGIAVTVDGFRRLGAAGNVDLAARARATGVIAAGSYLRAAAAAVVSTLWRTRPNIVMIEFTLVTVAVVVYVVNTIGLC